MEKESDGTDGLGCGFGIFSQLAKTLTWISCHTERYAISGSKVTLSTKYSMYWARYF